MRPDDGLPVLVQRLGAPEGVRLDLGLEMVRKVRAKPAVEAIESVSLQRHSSSSLVTRLGVGTSIDGQIGNSRRTGGGGRFSKFPLSLNCSTSKTTNRPTADLKFHD